MHWTVSWYGSRSCMICGCEWYNNFWNLIFVKQVPEHNPCYLPCQSRSLHHTGYMLLLKLRLKIPELEKDEIQDKIHRHRIVGIVFLWPSSLKQP
jgi:hypothetical protein